MSVTQTRAAMSAAEVCQCGAPLRSGAAARGNTTCRACMSDDAAVWVKRLREVAPTLPLPEIAKVLGRSQRAIRRVAKRFGVAIMRKARRKKSDFGNRYRHPTDELNVELNHWRDGKESGALVAQFGLICDLIEKDVRYRPTVYGLGLLREAV